VFSEQFNYLFSRQLPKHSHDREAKTENLICEMQRGRNKTLVLPDTRQGHKNSPHFDLQFLSYLHELGL
jgi:hypothetical protein